MKVNLLSGRTNFFLSPLLIVAVFALSFAFGRLTRSAQSGPDFSGIDNIPIIGEMSHLMSSPNRQLRGENGDRINVLLLGMGGEGHEGPNLTDTIIVASIKPSDNEVALLSIPRDLIVPLPKYGWQKINAANAYGEIENPGRGAEQARAILERLLGLDIPYYVRVDFNGFTQVIDAAGGIDVYVDRSFTDYSYPTDNYGVRVVAFNQGWHHMTGADALVFTRSRHGTNGEGSDFARAKRQQKVLAALKDKLLSASMLKNPLEAANAIAALKSNIATNFQIGEILRLAGMAGRMRDAQILHKIIDNGPDSPLVDGTFDGAYVLVPKNDDWSALRTVAANVFGEARADSSQPGKPSENDTANVAVMNGTGVSGSARAAASTIAGAGFRVVKIGNADTFSYQRSVIYDLTGGKKPTALARLKGTVGDAETRTVAPGALATDAAGVDFVFVLGQKPKA